MPSNFFASASYTRRLVTVTSNGLCESQPTAQAPRAGYLPCRVCPRLCLPLLIVACCGIALRRGACAAAFASEGTSLEE